MLALVLSGLVAWALARRIIRPVAAASSVAECIATGRLDVVIPHGGPDELGDLLSSMRLMRDNIKEMMDREVALRRSAQTRLADALENSDEGVVVVDAQDRIALANAQAAGFMSLSPEQLEPGTPIAELKTALRDPILADCMLSRPNGDPAAPDWQLADGRWLRVSRSATRDGGFIVVCSDITLSKRQEATLRQSNLRLDAALDNMSQGLCLFDAQNRLEVVNRRFFEIFGLSRDRVVPGISFREILELSAARRNHDGTTASQVLSDQAEVISRQKSGTHYYELSDGRIIASVYSPTSNGGWVATFEDVTERRLAEAQIMHMARHDALTDLPNRVLFRERMEQALDRGDKLAVLFVDLDRFKTVNDTLGHPVGDALLCAVTKRLQDAVRGSDMVARLGGDEFAIVQAGARPTDASELAARIIEAVSQPFDVLGHQVVIGASVGIAIAPTDGREPDQLLRNADMALYRAKSSGRGSYHFFQPEMDAQMQARHALEVDLRKAIAHGEFEVYYQPIVEVARREIRGFEALVRWNHPQRGLISPGAVHPARRGDRPDRRARRLGAAPGLPRRGRLARGHHRRRQSLGGAVPQSVAAAVDRLGARRRRPAGAPARARDHRNGAVAGRPRRHRSAAPDPRARRAHLDGRLRHRLFLARLSAQLPVRQDQDRPLVHPGARQEGRLPRHRARGDAARRRHRHGHHRRRRRDRRAARDPAHRRLQPGAGLSVQPAAADRRNSGAAGGVQDARRRLM